MVKCGKTGYWLLLHRHLLQGTVNTSCSVIWAIAFAIVSVCATHSRIPHLEIQRQPLYFSMHISYFFFFFFNDAECCFCVPVLLSQSVCAGLCLACLLFLCYIKWCLFFSQQPTGLLFVSRSKRKIFLFSFFFFPCRYVCLRLTACVEKCDKISHLLMLIFEVLPKEQILAKIFSNTARSGVFHRFYFNPESFLICIICLNNVALLMFSKPLALN